MKPIALYQKLAHFLNYGQSLFLVLIRLYIGYQSIIAGWGHFHNIDRTAHFFATLHIPAPKFSVIMSAGAELVGGALLLVGFGSRLVALVLAVDFFVAIFSVQLSNNDFSLREVLSGIWDNQDSILKDDAFPFLITALIVLFFGPGWFSIDGIIRRLRGEK